MISICPDCRGELERVDSHRVVELEGEYHPYSADVVDYTWICDVCLNFWRTTLAREAA